MKEKCLVYTYMDDCDMCKNQVEIPKAALIKFIKEVCLPMRETSKNRVADNKSGYFSKSYFARNYDGYVFDRDLECDAGFALFVCDNSGECYVQFSKYDDSSTYYEIPICWNLNKKGEIEFDYYAGEVEADV